MNKEKLEEKMLRLKESTEESIEDVLKKLLKHYKKKHEEEDERREKYTGCLKIKKNIG